MKKYVRSTTIYIVLALAILLPVWTAPFYASQKPDSQEYIQDIPDSEPKVLTVGYSPHFRHLHRGRLRKSPGADDRLSKRDRQI